MPLPRSCRAGGPAEQGAKGETATSQPICAAQGQDRAGQAAEGLTLKRNSQFRALPAKLGRTAPLLHYLACPEELLLVRAAGADHDVLHDERRQSCGAGRSGRRSGARSGRGRSTRLRSPVAPHLPPSRAPPRSSCHFARTSTPARPTCRGSRPRWSCPRTQRAAAREHARRFVNFGAQVAMQSTWPDSLESGTAAPKARSGGRSMRDKPPLTSEDVRGDAEGVEEGAGEGSRAGGGGGDAFFSKSTTGCSMATGWGAGGASRRASALATAGSSFLDSCCLR